MAFLRSLCAALAALAVSAGILIAAFSGLYARDTPPGAGNRVISGSEFSVVFGDARKSPPVLQLDGLSHEGRAILAHPTFLNAHDFPFLEYTIVNRSAGLNIYLLWRSSQNPRETSHTPLYWNGDGPVTVDLSKHGEWKGHITELALDIYGDLREQPVEFRQLVLKPYSTGAFLSSIWNEWTAYRGWTQKSVNSLRGTVEHPTLSPTLAIASWAGLALLLLFAFGTIKSAAQKKRQQALAYITAVLIPWIALDMLWQSGLTIQLDETKALFLGKTQNERQLADSDAALYEYTKQLKNDVLPDPGVRIFLLEDTPGLTYRRLKVQYYLLPHNLYNYDRLPKRNTIRKGDYILVLGKIKGLDYLAGNERLSWKSPRGIRKSLRVQRLDVDQLGTLYKVTGGRE